MIKDHKYSNSWIQAITWFDFQKNCAVYLFLKDYDNLIWKEFFIYLEHLDDFIFSIKDDEWNVNEVRIFQSKKSSSVWKISDLLEILEKLLQTNNSLKTDHSIKRSSQYFQESSFITNNEIKLEVWKMKVVINETKEKCWIKELDLSIKQKFIDGMTSVDLSNIDDIYFAFIDLPRTSEQQKLTLVWMLNRLFKNEINDPEAALDTLLELFRVAEHEYNQWWIIDWDNPNKRVNSSQIKEWLDIINTKKKAYELWRSEKKDLTKVLEIPLKDRNKFESIFLENFDRFKDITQVEHNKIFEFVKEQVDSNESVFDEVDLIKLIYDKFISETYSPLSELEIKSIIFSAIIEILNKQQYAN